MSDKDFQKILDEVRQVSYHYGTPMYCFHIDDKGIIEFRHITRNNLLGSDKSAYVQDSFGVAMFETKAEALKYLEEEKPALFKILIAQKVVGKEAYFPFELQFRIGRSNDYSFIPLKMSEAKELVAQMASEIEAVEGGRKPTGVAVETSDDWIYKRLAGWC